jgi:pimeloyl-ACP methyl ester carboxylesterase
MSPLEYTVTGEGPAILALHGAMGGCDQSLLLAQTVAPSAGYQFIAVSRPGYLGTPLSRGAAPEQQADLCAALLDELGIRSAAVMAVSGGGQCALQFALRHPDRCWGLVMFSACSAPITARLPLRFHLVRLIARSSFLMAALGKRAPVVRPDISDPEASRLFLALQFSTRDRLDQRMPGTLNDIKQSRGPFDYPLERIAAPLLVVHGTMDEAVPYAQAQSLAARVPGARLLTCEGARHIAIFTHRQEVRAEVARFVAAHRPA